MKTYIYNSEKLGGLVGVSYDSNDQKILDIAADVTTAETHTNLAKLNKRQFEKLYHDGTAAGLFIQSNKMTPINPWQSALHVDAAHLEENNTTLESYINNYKYYNCDSERGRGVAYYVDLSNPIAAMDINNLKIKLYL